MPKNAQKTTQLHSSHRLARKLGLGQYLRIKKETVSPPHSMLKNKEKQKNYTKKDLYDPDNHNDVITHLESDILEYEVKWALGGITMNKASGDDGIPVELLQILKDDTAKVLH